MKLEVFTIHDRDSTEIIFSIEGSKYFFSYAATGGDRTRIKTHAAMVKVINLYDFLKDGTHKLNPMRLLRMIGVRSEFLEKLLSMFNVDDIGGSIDAMISSAESCGYIDRNNPTIFNVHYHNNLSLEARQAFISSYYERKIIDSDDDRIENESKDVLEKIDDESGLISHSGGAKKKNYSLSINELRFKTEKRIDLIANETGNYVVLYDREVLKLVEIMGPRKERIFDATLLCNDKKMANIEIQYCGIELSPEVETKVFFKITSGEIRKIIKELL